MSSTSGDVLRFFARSADKAPGKGAGESVANPVVYARLARTPNWRQVLSNFHLCPFTYEGRTYRTIEHAFQAAKIRLEDPVAAESFTVESGSPLGVSGDGLEARKHRKMVRLPPAKIAAWDAFSGEAMARMARAKFRQCPEARQVLLDTLNAQLWHAAPRMAPVRFVHLEQLRSDLRDQLRRSP